MKTEAEHQQVDATDLAAVNNLTRSWSIQDCIASQAHRNPDRRRDIDFGAIDRGLAAAERLVAVHGPDTILPGTWRETAAGLLIKIRDIAASAAPYRPKVRRA
jgi:hypothetical protein